MYTNVTYDGEREDTHTAARHPPSITLKEPGAESINEAPIQTKEVGDEIAQPGPSGSSPVSEQTNKADGDGERDGRVIFNEDDAPADTGLLIQEEKRSTFKRIVIATGVIFASLTLLTGISYFWLLGGWNNQMNYQVNNSGSSAESPSANDAAQGITAEEIARELKKPVTTPKNSSENLRASDGGGGTPRAQIQSAAPVTDRLPEDNFSVTVGPNASGSQQPSATATTMNSASSGPVSAAAAAPAGGTEATQNSRSNIEHSIHISAPPPLPAAAPEGVSPSASSKLSSARQKPKRNMVLEEEADEKPSVERAESRMREAVPLPPLGELLPVRTLGTIYTLRNDSYFRMQLTRDMAGRGWRLPRGTEFYGTLRGSELETGRAFVSLIGFIDPGTNRLVRLQGNLLGGDGSDGVKGRRHKLDSGWVRALKMAGAGMVDALSNVAAGVGRRPVYVGDIYGYGAPRAIGPLAQEISGIAYGSGGRRASGFVEVPANTAGYILVMTTPREIQGADAEGDVNHVAVELQRSSNADESQSNARITERELSELLTDGNPDDVRQALPHMSPEMRRVAEVFLQQNGN